MQILENFNFTSQLLVPFYCINFSEQYFTPNSFQYYGQPFPEQLNKAVIKRKAEYLAGRICATRALDKLGFKHQIIGTSKSRAPLWPVKAIGSISHTTDLAIAIVMHANQAKGIGIDIEKKMPDELEDNLNNQILREDEILVFQRLGKQLSSPLSIIFSAKESIYKALYASVGEFFGFKCAKLLDFNQNMLTFQIMDTLSSAVPAGTKLNVYYQVTSEYIVTECLFC
ncbi:4'-phosphopantetheinyl transferase superfamily protein [Pseudoalteromonas sp.]|uniref:4'-phosphopantetheinyl transferase family protein n=1 Tax=Pseudoalteromonas sp. TaxID=53249 RepID=UPI002355B008|nr:4'-phosphopantetheinyl transferase superfamily protein [Pseudoalteromonas sp.]